MPHEELLALRRTAPVSFVEQEPAARAGFPDHTGYWAVTKHADVAAVSKDQANFSTASGRRDHPVRARHGPRRASSSTASC